MEAASNCVTVPTGFFVTIYSGCTLEKGRYFIYEVTWDQVIFLPFGAVFKVQGPLQLF